MRRPPSGCRAKKAVQKEVAALREELGKLHSWDWLQAQTIYNQIMELCGVTNRTMAPRSCVLCKRYGHTRQHCKSFINTFGDAKEYTPLQEHECSPEWWSYQQHLKAITARVEEGDSFLRQCERQGPVSCASDYLLDCTCEPCREWREWMAPTLAEYKK